MAEVVTEEVVRGAGREVPMEAAVDAVATWPRRAGYAEFYLRRCIMHTVRRPLRPFRLPF